MGGLEEQISESRKLYQKYNRAANVFRVLFFAGIVGYGMNNAPSVPQGQRTFVQSVGRHPYFLGYEGLCVLGLLFTASRERKYYYQEKQRSDSTQGSI